MEAKIDHHTEEVAAAREVEDALGTNNKRPRGEVHAPRRKEAAIQRHRPKSTTRSRSSKEDSHRLTHGRTRSQPAVGCRHADAGGARTCPRRRRRLFHLRAARSSASARSRSRLRSRLPMRFVRSGLAVSIVKHSGCFPRAGIAEGPSDARSEPHLRNIPEAHSTAPSLNVEFRLGPCADMASAQARLSQVGEILVDASVGLLREEALRARTGGHQSYGGRHPRGPYRSIWTRPSSKRQRRSASAPRGASRAMRSSKLLAKFWRSRLQKTVRARPSTNPSSNSAQRASPSMWSSVSLPSLRPGRGATEEGLRLLQSAAESSNQVKSEARSVLAYSIGVALVGRPEDALLEGLAALALARETNDEGGERACARFLAQLSASSGHPEAARAWAHVARRIGPAPWVGAALSRMTWVILPRASKAVLRPSLWLHQVSP